jgi:AcrR family transcriptional regulator
MRANAQVIHSYPVPTPIAREKPRKAPVQARSRATYEAILEATARILEAEGLAAVTTNRVAERAGVSIGSLYQYFPAREAILAELVKRMRLSMSARMIAISEATRSRPLEEAIPAIMAAAIEQYEAEPRLTAALEAAEARLPRDPEVVAERRRARDTVVACLRSRRVPRPEEAAQDLIAMTRGIVIAALGGSRKADCDRIRARIVRAAMGYLTYRG